MHLQTEKLVPHEMEICKVLLKVACFQVLYLCERPTGLFPNLLFLDSDDDSFAPESGAEDQDIREE